MFDFVLYMLYKLGMGNKVLEFSSAKLMVSMELAVLNVFTLTNTLKEKPNTALLSGQQSYEWRIYVRGHRSD